MMVSSGDSNGNEVFVPVTRRDVWNKLIELEKRVDALNIKIYAFAGAVAAIAAFLSVTGGIHIG